MTVSSLGLGCGDGCGCDHCSDGLEGILGDLGLDAYSACVQAGGNTADAAAICFQHEVMDTSTTPIVQDNPCPPGFVWNGMQCVSSSFVCPTGYVFDGNYLTGTTKLSGLMGLRGCQPTAATIAAQQAAAAQAAQLAAQQAAAQLAAQQQAAAQAAAAQAAQDLANRKARAANECPTGYEWDGVLDSVTTGLTGLGGCKAVAPPPSPPTPTQQQQQQQNQQSGTQNTTPSFLANITTPELLVAGVGLVVLAFFVGGKN